MDKEVYFSISPKGKISTKTWNLFGKYQLNTMKHFPIITACLKIQDAKEEV